jgi:hypothetical protein
LFALSSPLVTFPHGSCPSDFCSEDYPFAPNPMHPTMTPPIASVAVSIGNRRELLPAVGLGCHHAGPLVFMCTRSAHRGRAPAAIASPSSIRQAQAWKEAQRGGTSKHRSCQQPCRQISVGSPLALLRQPDRLARLPLSFRLLVVVVPRALPLRDHLLGLTLSHGLDQRSQL